MNTTKITMRKIANARGLTDLARNLRSAADDGVVFGGGGVTVDGNELADYYPAPTFGGLAPKILASWDGRRDVVSWNMRSILWAVWNGRSYDYVIEPR